jgi:hypothetical protein
LFASPSHRFKVGNFGHGVKGGKICEGTGFQKEKEIRALWWTLRAFKPLLGGLIEALQKIMIG